MGATFVSAVIAIVVVCGAALHPELGGFLMFPRLFFVWFFGLFLLASAIPWRRFSKVTSDGGAYLLAAWAEKSQMNDRRLWWYRLFSYLIAFMALVVINWLLIPPLYRFVYAIVSAAILLDVARRVYQRMQYRTSAEGVAEFLEESMRSFERSSDLEALLGAFESTFSILSVYAKMNDTASLRLFCSKLVANADFWTRASAKLPGSMSTMHEDSAVLDSYTIIEAMVAKRMASIVQEALKSESLAVFETLVWFIGRLSLAFHARHSSLGYVLLLSLSEVLQGTEGNIDKNGKEMEYISMLSEVIKAYIDKSVATNSSNRTSIFRALALLERHLKESFHNDRSINPAFLMQPFAEVGQRIAGEKYTAMPDRDDIIAELRRLLAQFAALEGVRSQMDIGGVGTDTKASYHEDKPFLTKNP